jgi:hypothetical protein
MIYRIWAGVICGVLAIAVDPAGLPASEPGAADSMVIHLAGGKILTGELAPKTDAAELWLTQQTDTITLTRPIAWDCVVKASVLGREFSGQQLRLVVEAIRQRNATPIEVRPQWLILRNPILGDELPQQPRPIPPSSPPVRHLEIEAATAAWSETADPDGLVVQVYPLSDRGDLVPAWGTLEVELIGRGPGTVTDPQAFQTLGRWTQEVRPEDFGPRGAVYRMAFQAIRPDFDLAVGPAAAVHARLSVPGQGTFDATQSTVRIRPLSPVRDELQQATGRRFFPTERMSQ